MGEFLGINLTPMATAILLVSCPDQKGLVAKLSDFVFKRGGNIIHADHHNDSETSLFLSRIEWDLDGFEVARDEISPALRPLAETIQASWELHFSDTVRRIAIWVSREDHCLMELLWRQRSNDLHAEIPLVISNHRDLESAVRERGIEFRHVPIAKGNKAEQEAAQLELLRRFKIDLVVLAKYMQILSPEFIAAFPRVINIHHSFLPAFSGANPYKRAYDRGVKIIGATAHYATADLDAGPIIEQDVVRISHRDEVSDLVRKGRDLERIVLARAVLHHLNNRVLVYRNKTVVFA